MKNSRHAAHTSQLIAAGVGRGDHAADGKGRSHPWRPELRAMVPLRSSCRTGVK